MKFVKIICLCTLISLPGCRGYFAGHTGDMTQLVVGDGIIDPLQGTIKFDTRLPGLGFTCSGLMETVLNLYAFGGIGNKLSGKFNCTDGRKGTAQLTVIEVGEAKGTGTDDCGNVYHIYSAIDEETIDELKNEYTEKIKASGRDFIDKCDAKGGMPEHFDPII